MALLTENWAIDALYALIGFSVVFYTFVKHVYSYWERKGFKQLSEINYLFGHFKPCFLQQKCVGVLLVDLYKRTTEPFIGMYSVFRPKFLVRDPELVRSVLVKDFSYFADRGIYYHEKDTLSGNLFNLPGQRWKNLRSKLSPAFTSGKLKAMFDTLNACGDSLQKYLGNAAENNQIVDIRELAARHTTNVISSVGFGLDVNTITSPDSDFRKYGKKSMEANFWNGVRAALNFTAPKLMTIFGLKLVDKDVEDFFKSIVKQNLDYRENNNYTRKDFFQLLIQLRNNGTVQLDDEWETVIKSDENQKTMSLDEIAAQVFVFFVAGYETSSTTLSFCLYELAKQPELQKRVLNEIDQVLEKNDGKITYDSVSEMKYLECCIDETLRMYPVLPMLNRICLKDYHIPGSKNILETGVELFIPVLALHRDEKFYPEPNKFIPDRFNEENSLGKNQLNRPYIPFGDGPRNCIGMRLGKMQTKVGLVLMLQKFRYEMKQELMNKEPAFSPDIFLLAPRDGIHLNVLKR